MLEHYPQISITGQADSGLVITHIFSLCAGGAAEISRWRQPPESPLLLPLRPGRGAGPESDRELFRRLRSRPAPLPGREEFAAWIRWLAPPANIHGPFRAKGGKLRGPKNVGNDKRIKPGVERDSAQPQ